MNKYPKLRTHVRKGKAGRARIYYVYDGRPGKDIPLGSDYALAIEQWDQIHNKRPRIKGTLEEAFERFETDALPKYEQPRTRRAYAQSLKMLRANKVGRATWEGVRLADLVGYLDKRSAKIQGNREMALLGVIWNYARKKGITELPWPAAGLGKSRWKNPEPARHFEVTDALFAAVYESAGPLLRDCMDISTATGMRITDARLCTVPSTAGALGLPMSASKTGKRAIFDLTQSAVLTGLLERRRAIKADHLFLLTTPGGKPVTESMLRGAWDRARVKAAKAHPELAEQIGAMYLRDMRKRASDLAGSLAEASKLLQHSSERVTSMHYRTKAEKVRPVR